MIEFNKYGILSNNGKLLRLDIVKNKNNNACNPTRVTLTESDGGPVYEADSIESALFVYATDTPWYNSSEKYPSHGDINMDQCRVVKLRTLITEITDWKRFFKLEDTSPLDPRALHKLRSSFNLNNLEAVVVSHSSLGYEDICSEDRVLIEGKVLKCLKTFSIGQLRRIIGIADLESILDSEFILIYLNEK